MDIYEYLHKDHEKVDGLIKKVMTADSVSERESLFSEIKEELTVHAKSEEKTFYRAIEEAADDESAKKKLKHAEHEHNEIEDCLDSLSTTPIDSASWMKTVKELQRLVTHHVKEEEGDVFTKAKKCLTSAQAKELVTEMEKTKKEFKKN